MSRAIRRQQSKQSAAPKESAAQQPRSLGVNRRPPTTSRGARAPISAKKRLLKQPAWMGDITSELRKVTWPTRDETVYLTTVVIVVALVVGTLLGGIDLFFNWLIDRLLLR
jgi:preprotein translocase subunit SecE